MKVLNNIFVIFSVLKDMFKNLDVAYVTAYCHYEYFRLQYNLFSRNVLQTLLLAALLYCSGKNGSECRPADLDCEKPDVGEEFPDDFQSETDEDEYSVEWNRDGVSSDAVDSHRCELFAIAEEKSPDLVHEQSWPDAENHGELTGATDDLEENGEEHSLESNQFSSRNWKQWRLDEEQERSYSFDNERYRETPWTAENDFEGEEETRCFANETADRAISGFDDRAPEMFNYAMSRSFGMDGLSTHKEQLVGNGEINYQSTESNTRTHEQLDEDDANQPSSNGQDQSQAGSYPEGTLNDQADEDREVVEWKNEVMCGVVEEEIEDDIADRCAWNCINDDFITSQLDSWPPHDQRSNRDFEPHLHHHSSAQKSLKAEMAESEEETRNELYIHEERFSDGDPRSDGYWNENCQKSTEFASPTSSVDVDHMEDYSQLMTAGNDQGQLRIVGRRWAKTSGSGTVDSFQMSDVSCDHGTDQPTAEQDTLPRRGHMKNLLAQWRQLEQRRKDEELIELAASTGSDRSRRPAVRTAWFKTSDSDQQRVLASSRSQSCGPVSRRPAKVQEFDGSSSWRNGNVDDGEESEMTFDRMAIKEKFERLDAEAQRTTISNRKKVDNNLVFTLLSHRSKVF